MLQLLSAFAITTLLIISFFIMRRLRPSQSLQAAKKTDHSGLPSSLPEPTMLSKALASAIPDSVILPHDATAFKQSMSSYWAQQECEVIPACIVRPPNVQQLCTAVTILKSEYDEREKLAGGNRAKGLFAIRSGGHSPVPGAASIKGGILIDLGLFCEVTPSEDESNVVIGAGAKWMDVSQVLDNKGLAVIGGRNSAVGVGGLTLGGKFLLFMSIQTLSCGSMMFRQQLCFLKAPELTKPHRRPLIFLPPVRPSLLQHLELRNRPCFWVHHHSLRIRQHRPLARPQRRLQQLWHRHPLHGPQLSLYQNLERLPLYAGLPSLQGPCGFPRLRQ